MIVPITLEISTKDRYDALAVTLNSICMQTVLPQEIIIYDDGAQIDLRNNSIFKNIFVLLNKKGVVWRVLMGEKKGQVLNHIKAIEAAHRYHEWIFRVDDDVSLEPNVIELIWKEIQSNPEAIAVAPLALQPMGNNDEANTSPYIKDVYEKYACQLGEFSGKKEVEHLHCTFCYKRELARGCYPTGLSPVAHREETIFSHNLFRKGGKMIVLGDARAWHYRHDSGGIRTYKRKELWENDEKVFKKWIEDNNILTKTKEEVKVIYLYAGIGDNWMTMEVLRDRFLEEYPDEKFVVATSRKNVWHDFNHNRVKVVDLEEGQRILGRQFDYSESEFNYYRNGERWEWKKSFPELIYKTYKDIWND